MKEGMQSVPIVGCYHWNHLPLPVGHCVHHLLHFWQQQSGSTWWSADTGWEGLKELTLAAFWAWVNRLAATVAFDVSTKRRSAGRAKAELEFKPTWITFWVSWVSVTCLALAGDCDMPTVWFNTVSPRGVAEETWEAYVNEFWGILDLGCLFSSGRCFWHASSLVWHEWSVRGILEVPEEPTLATSWVSCMSFTCLAAVVTFNVPAV